MRTWTTWMRTTAAVAVLLAAASAGAVAVGAVGDGADGGLPGMPRAGASSPSESVFVPITPCRIVNTQNSAGKMQVDEVRQYRMHGGTSAQGGAAACGIPAAASALEMTVTAVSAEGPGYLRVYPFGVATPNATFLNYGAGQNIGNTGTVAVAPGALNLQVRAYQARTHVVIDVSGYHLRGLQASFFADGTIARSNGVVSGGRSGTGTYLIGFDRDVRGCAFGGTIGLPDPGSATTGLITVSPLAGTPHGVQVQTFTTGSSLADRPFHVTATC